MPDKREATSDDVESTAAELSEIKPGDELGEVPVGAVDVGGDEVVLTMELPSGTEFTHSFNRPPVWGANCELKRLLDAFDLGPDEADQLVGRRLPCEREVRDDGLHFWVDVDALVDGS